MGTARPQREEKHPWVRFIPGEGGAGTAPQPTPKVWDTLSESCLRYALAGRLGRPDGSQVLLATTPRTRGGILGPSSSPALWSICFSEQREAPRGWPATTWHAGRELASSPTHGKLRPPFWPDLGRSFRPRGGEAFPSISWGTRAAADLGLLGRWVEWACVCVRACACMYAHLWAVRVRAYTHTLSEARPPTQTLMRAALRGWPGTLHPARVLVSP